MVNCWFRKIYFWAWNHKTLTLVLIYGVLYILYAIVQSCQ